MGNFPFIVHHKVKMFAIFVLFSTLQLITAQNVAVQEFLEGNINFTAAVYKELANSNSGNLLFSPFSVEVILSLVQEGARGTTRQELLHGLFLPNDTQTVFRSILPTLTQNNSNIQLLSANRIYIQENFTILTTYQNIATNIYESGIQNVNFQENVQTAEIINDWIENQTNNRIQNLINPNSLNGNTRLVLVNALYLNANWTYPFNNRTKRMAFHLNNENSVEVDFLYQTNDFYYYENAELDVKCLTLPYDDSNVTMTIILPNAIEGLNNNNIIDDIFVTPKIQTRLNLTVFLPPFSITTGDIEFIPILKQLGINAAFGPSADFSGIDGKTDLFISQVVQRAFINVTRTGTEAAAVTSATVTTTVVSPPPPNSFIVNHPFLFVLRDSNAGILFAGRLNTL